MILSKALRAAAGNVAPAPPSTDPQFNYVSLLLHGDGTNGAQNNTFLDSSSNNFTITRNGNTTQGSLSPYGNLWSNYFDGSTGYLSFSNIALSGDFTIETWVYRTNDNLAFRMLAGESIASTGTWISQNAIQFGNSGSTVAEMSFAFAPNTWYHVAFTRSSNVVRIFVNGVQQTVSNNVQNNTLNIAYLGIGYSTAFYLPGYLSNFRIVNGSAIYTANFTPPTAPLTAISGTSLLTCQSNRFRDASANNFTITRTGDVRVTKEAPFLPTAAYSTSTIGGSGYFNGTGNYLTASSVTFAGDFTVEGWVFIANLSGNRALVQIGDGSTSTGPFFYVSTAGKFIVYAAGILITGSATLTANTWVHLAVCRSGSTIKSYVNGVLDATTTNSTTFTGTVRVGAEWYTGTLGSTTMNGYISDLRLVTGTAVYTSNFTPPTAPLTAITNTSLLLNFTNAGIFDNAAENVLETVGNAQISTSVKKYGTGSLAFDGAGDWLLAPDSPNIQLGVGTFTIECWVYRTTSGSAKAIAGKGASETTGWEIGLNSSDLFFFTIGTSITSSALVPLNTWTHVAVVRTPVSNGTTLYVNGVSSATTTSTTNFNDSGLLYVGAGRTGRLPFTGYIDDFRITKGVARYTANFTPPTAAFPDQ